jgi:NTE family protein
MKSTPAHSLESLDIFAELAPAERDALCAEFETLALKSGDVLVRQGEVADALYLVISGRFAVTIEGREGVLAEMGQGQPIGEIAFLAGGTRTATVHAIRDSLVLRLARSEFDRLTAKLPSIWSSLTVTLARRLSKASAVQAPRSDPQPRTITLIRAGGGPLPPDFLQLFASVFPRALRTRIIVSKDVHDLLPRGTSFESPLATRALNALEGELDFVVFLADAELTAWSHKAIRQADLVLAVGAFDSDPSVNALERCAAEYLRPEAQRLVLTHTSHRRVSGTRRWLSARSVVMHHHVALDRASDVERLFRFINGTARGLVAGGGGAFCAAHVGIYAALLDAGVPIDMMGGTSAGGAYTAAFALERTPDEIDRATHEMFVTDKALGRYTWPRYSLFDHTNFDRALIRSFGGNDIEDLWIPYFAISTNLSSYERYCHRRGELWAAVRATASIPVVLPPFYTDEGHMLVDGCLLDNVPIATMHQMKSGPNIVVSLRVPRLECFDVRYSAFPSRGDLLRRVINPLRSQLMPHAPGPITVLLRSLESGREDFKRHMRPSDLLLTPPMPPDMGILDWHRHTELMEAAHHWGRSEIARLQAEAHPALATTAPIHRERRTENERLKKAVSELTHSIS